MSEWKWYLKDLCKIEKNGYKVISFFSCGGGSSMGYKLAGYEVIGNCEIDPRVIKLYRENLHPKYSYLMDIREFEKIPNNELPSDFFNIDILDGSPPCSVFSTAGEREKGWGTEKVFREGQSMQRLDDLFFHYIAIAKKLQPKIIVAENVTGLIKGNAKGYVNEIIKAFNNTGYEVQLFLLNSAVMGVPQARERVFFIGKRKDLNFPKLELNFNEKPIPFGEIRTPSGKPVKTGTQTEYLLKFRKEEDKTLGDIMYRLYGKKNSRFTHTLLSDNRVAPALISGGPSCRMFDAMNISDGDIINMQTFPQDYNFGDQSAKYICGMSVPPVMMKKISEQIQIQLLDKRVKKDE